MYLKAKSFGVISKTENKIRPEREITWSEISLTGTTIPIFENCSAVEFTKLL